MKKLFITLLLGTAFLLSGKEIFLMKDGKSVCNIVLSKNACAVEKYASQELADFLAKISHGEKPSISKNAVKGKVNIRFALTKDKKVEQEGFKITAKGNEILISGKEPVAYLYGVYHILKKYGGIRWLTPLPDGEYFTVKKTIKMPELDLVSNPSFFFRTISWGGASILSPKWGSYDWMNRNNLRIVDSSIVILHKSMNEQLTKRAALIRDGGHCFSDLLAGRWVNPRIKNHADMRKELERLFKEHPEYFPMVNGKRVFLEGHKYQPCTSNEDVVRIMSENLIKELKTRTSKTPGGMFRLVNNDGTGWCECENCKKIDGNDKGMTTRYWQFINRLTENALKAVPNARINAIAYQNYQEAPKTILPHKGLESVEYSFNRLCYRHFIDDPNCAVNAPDYHRKHKEWAALAKKHGYKQVTYAQIDDLGVRGMPIDEVYLHDIKYYYHTLGIRGLRPQLLPVDGRYSKKYSDNPMIVLQWHSLWQVLYGFAQLCWDVDANVDAIYEESGSLYYGKAWNNGMKQYKKLLNKTYRETPGCHGHGHSSPLGRCLDHPQTHKMLLAYLDSAEKAAKTDPDKRSLKHVQTERKIFNLTWEKFRKDYEKNFREIRSYRKQKEIKIDGNLDEFDWKNADIVSGFRTIKLNGTPAKYPTVVRIVHEPDAIYFGIEAMDNEIEKMLAGIKEKDGPVWTDSTIELFLTFPDLGNSYYQIIINSIGTVFDQFVQPGIGSNVKWDSQIQLKTKILKDRWVLEAKIPTGPIGEKCFDGQFWKINVMRSRKVFEQGKNEASTWSMGMPHSVDAFHAVNFVAARANNNGYEQDTRTFRNGTMNEKSKIKYKSNKLWKVKDGVMPANWAPTGRSGDVEYIQDKANAMNHYLRLKGIISNDYMGKGTPFVKIRIRAKGKGTFYPAWYCYDVVNGRRKHKASLRIGKFDFDHADWKDVVIEADLPKYAVTKFALESVPAKGAEVFVDSVLITPLNKKSGKK